MATYSYACRKVVYLHHTKYLPDDHPYRRDSSYFLDTSLGRDDERPIPKALTLQDWHEVWRRVGDPEDPLQYERCGINFMSSLNDLEYWPKLKLNHLLDPMHIEGNVCKSLISHMFGEKGDGWRAACEEHDMHPDLWTYRDEGGYTVNPPHFGFYQQSTRKSSFSGLVHIGCLQIMEQICGRLLGNMDKTSGQHT